MRLEICNNNGKQYFRIVESIRVENSTTKTKVNRKKIIKNIGPVSRFDDGKPNFVERVKTSYTAGAPIIEELKPYLNKDIKRDIYDIRLHEGTDECVSNPKLMASAIFERLFEELDLSQLVRTYKNKYDCSFDVFGFLKTLVFGRILKPASKISTVSQSDNYFTPLIKGKVEPFNVYETLDFIYKHKSAFFNRINTSMMKKFGRTTSYVYYDVANFFFETDEADEDPEDLRHQGVSKEERDLPIVQMGLLMDEQGCPISVEAFPGNRLDHLTLQKAFENSVSKLGNEQNRYIYVCDKGIGRGDNLGYAVANGNGYLTSKSVRGSKNEDKAWILDSTGYTVTSDNFKYKSRIITKKLSVPGKEEPIVTSEKQVTYWSRAYYERERNEKKQFYELVEQILQSPENFRVTKLQRGLLKKYAKKTLVNTSSGEVIDANVLRAELDMKKLQEDMDLMGYYTIITSEINMDDLSIINKYRDLVEIEDQFRVMKSTLDTRPIFVRNKDHIIAHLSICAIALLLIRLIQRQIKKNNPKESINEKDKNLFEFGLSANRIQEALNKWTADKLGDKYYRFAGINDPDLKLILDSFDIQIPKKCFTLAELKHFKFMANMSL